jgi:glycosyltransferase involved in cell wall biosynthesis
MRILYHHRTTARDGSAVHINGLIDALRSLGAEVRVVAPRVAAQAVGDATADSWVRRVRRSLPRLLHELAELGYNLGEVRALTAAVRDFKPDFIYQRSNLYLLSGAVVARRQRLPLIEEVNAPYLVERVRHGGIAWRGLAEWTERTALTRADAVVAVTRVLADMIAEHGVSPARLHVMPNGIDETMLPESAIDRSAKARLGLSGLLVLGFTGFVRDWNGLDRVIDLLAGPGRESWFLLVVGDGPARESLERHARQRGVEGRLRFTGVVRRNEIASLVSAFDIALQPAANPYASPLKLFEYLALGRAVVAPDQPNIREILTPDSDAVLFEPGNGEAMASAVTRLATDDALRERLAAAGRQTVLRRGLTWRNNAQQVLEIARGLLAARAEKSQLLGADAGH